MANIGTLWAHIGLDDRQLTLGAARAQNTINRLTNTASANAAQITAVLGGIGLALGAAAVGQAFRQITQLGVDFERQMKVVGGVARASGAELAALTDRAKEMGEKTEYSAKQAADALYFLSSAGLSVKEQIAAIPGVLDLATAGNVDLAFAADTAVGALKGMRLPVEELGRVNDVLVGTVNRTNTDLRQLAEAFTYAAPVAGAFGYSIEELAGMIGVLSDANIKGSMAGTQLSMAMQDAQEIAQKFGFESSDLVDVLRSLKERGIEGYNMMQLFGERSGKAALIIADLIDGTRSLQDELLETGGEAKKLGDEIRDSLWGSFQELTSIVETVGLDSFDAYKASLKDLIDSATEWIRDHKDEIVGLIAAVSEAAIEVADAVGEAISAIEEVVSFALRAMGATAEEGEEQIESLIDEIARLKAAEDAAAPDPGPWKELWTLLKLIAQNLLAIGKLAVEAFVIPIGNAIGIVVSVARDAIGILAALGNAAKSLVTGQLAEAKRFYDEASRRSDDFLLDYIANVEKVGETPEGQPIYNVALGRKVSDLSNEIEDALADAWKNFEDGIDLRTVGQRIEDEWSEAMTRARIDAEEDFAQEFKVANYPSDVMGNVLEGPPLSDAARARREHAKPVVGGAGKSGAAAAREEANAYRDLLAVLRDMNITEEDKAAIVLANEARIREAARKEAEDLVAAGALAKELAGAYADARYEKERLRMLESVGLVGKDPELAGYYGGHYSVLPPSPIEVNLEGPKKEDTRKVEEEIVGWASDLSYAAGNAIDDGLFAVIKGDLDELDRAFQAFGDSVIRVFTRMAAEAAALRLYQSFVGGAGSFEGGYGGGGFPTDIRGGIIEGPPMATGGIVTSPTLALVGDVPEAIIPLSRASEVLARVGEIGGEGGNTYHLSLVVPGVRDVDAWRKSEGSLLSSAYGRMRRMAERDGV